MKLEDIVFPVYKLGSKPIEEGNKLYFQYGKNMGEYDEQSVIQYIDDKSFDSPYLSSRRLKMKAAGINLAPIKQAIFFLNDFIKVAASGIWFIDTEGKAFTYTKTKRVRLIYRPISKIYPITTGGAIIEVKGIPSRFKCLYMPDVTLVKFAGLLEFKNSHILYGLYDKEYDSSIKII